MWSFDETAAKKKFQQFHTLNDDLPEVVAQELRDDLQQATQDVTEVEDQIAKLLERKKTLTSFIEAHKPLLSRGRTLPFDVLAHVLCLASGSYKDFKANQSFQ